MSIETELLQRLQSIDARLRSLERIELPTAGGGGFVTGAGVANEIAFWSAAATLSSSPRIIRANSGNLFTISAGAATDVLYKGIAHASQSASVLELYNAAGTRLLFVVGASGNTRAYISMTARRYGNNPSMILERSEGSEGSEAYLTSGQVIGRYDFAPITTPATPAWTARAAISAVAAENHSATNQGVRLHLFVTPLGSTTITLAGIVSPNGNLILGTLSEAGTNATRTYVLENGVPPAGNLLNASQLYNDDRFSVAGDGWPHFRSEAGTVRALLGEVSADVIGTTSYSLTVPATGTAALRSDKLSAFAATSSAELAGVLSDETGSASGGLAVFNNAPAIVSPDLSGTVSLSPASGLGKDLRLFIRKTGIADNVATEVFKVETTNESGSTDGGGYVCLIEAMVGHQATSGAGSGAVKSWSGRFSRQMTGAGAGVNTAIENVFSGASAAGNTLVRDLGTITVTVAETTEYDVRVSFQIDTTGSSATTAELSVTVTVIYGGFLTAPVITGL